jgi:hypothetical protein
MTGMVIRCKIAVQDDDFDIEHIPGVDDIVVDGLSRLNRNPCLTFARAKQNPGPKKISVVPQTLALLYGCVPFGKQKEE